MNFDILRRVCRIAAAGTVLLCSAACVNVNEELGENLIPTDQLWDVFPQEPAPLSKIRMHMTDSLSGYNADRITFGATNDDVLGTCIKGSHNAFPASPSHRRMPFCKATQYSFPGRPCRSPLRCRALQASRPRACSNRRADSTNLSQA